MLAVGFDPFVFASVGQRRSVQVTGLFEQVSPVAAGGDGGLVEQAL
jgi:hypothetical protein